MIGLKKRDIKKCFQPYKYNPDIFRNTDNR